MTRFAACAWSFCVCTHWCVAQSYVLQVTGPTSVHQGYASYLSVLPVFSETPSSIVWGGVEGPPGVSGTMITRFRSAEGRPFAWYGPDKQPVPFLVEVTAAESAAVGTHTIALVTERNGVRETTPVPFRVKAKPTPPTPAASSPRKSINKSQWERTMLTLGAKWCKADEVMKFGWEQQVWYYDGGRVYLQMADYTGDRRWEDCGFHVLDQYRDAILAQGGWGQGWRVFTKGLRLAYERTGDPRYRDAVHLLATKSPYAASGGTVGDMGIRETAFILQAYIDDARLGAPSNPNMARSAAFLMGHFEALFDTGNFEYHQTFWDGLAAEALIDYYALTADPRVPDAIRTMLDWIWEHGWDHASHQLVYNPEPAGPRCNNSCQKYGTELINLVAPAFAWYWSVTGDLTYLDHGDILFSHALDTDIGYSGKIFSQNFRWSPSYLQWRGTPARDPGVARRPPHASR